MAESMQPTDRHPVRSATSPAWCSRADAASRMGGVDKGLQPLDGEPLALHALRRARAAMRRDADQRQSQPRDLRAARHAVRRKGDCRYACPTFPARLPGSRRRCTQRDTEFVLFAPCDAPFVDPHLAERLFARLERRTTPISRPARSSMPPANATLHPVFALLRTSLADDLDAFIWCRRTQGPRVVRAPQDGRSRPLPTSARFTMSTICSS